MRDHGDPPATPDSATFPYAPVISNAAQLRAHPNTVAQTSPAPPQEGFDFVLCDICAREVPIQWTLDASGEQIHDIDAHDRSSHYECLYCRNLVAKGTLHGAPHTHDQVCTSRAHAIKWYCSHCGIGMVDELWFRKEHMDACRMSARLRGAPNGYDITIGKARMKAGLMGEKGEKVEDMMATTAAVPEVLASSATTTALAPTAPLIPRLPNPATPRVTGPDIVFNCKHCGIGVLNQLWYMKEHIRPCSHQAVQNGTTGNYNTETGLLLTEEERKKKNERKRGREGKEDRQDPWKVVKTGSTIRADPAYGRLAFEDDVAPSTTPDSPLSPTVKIEALDETPALPMTDRAVPQDRDAEITFYCKHCGIPITDERAYNKEHYGRCKEQAIRNGTADRYRTHNGTLKSDKEGANPYKKVRARPAQAARKAAARNDEIHGRLSFQNSIAPSTTLNSAVPLASRRDAEHMAPEVRNAIEFSGTSAQQDPNSDILFYCKHCGIAVTDQTWFHEKHMEPCTAAANENGTLERFRRTTGNFRAQEKLAKTAEKLSVGSRALNRGGHAKDEWDAISETAPPYTRRALSPDVPSGPGSMTRRDEGSRLATRGDIRRPSSPFRDASTPTSRPTLASRITQPGPQRSAQRNSGRFEPYPRRNLWEKRDEGWLPC
jgi:hypothetical protein